MTERRNDLARRIGDAWSALMRRARAARATLRNARRNLVQRCARAMLLRMSWRTIERCATLLWWANSLVNARVRWNGRIRYELGRGLYALDRAKHLRTKSSGTRERLIDLRLHIGRQRDAQETWPDLQRVAAALAHEIEAVRAASAGRPVIVAPFHYVSQYANIYVVDALRAQLGLPRMSVVSGMPRNIYGNDSAAIPNLRILYTYDDGERNGLGLRFIRALRRDGVAVLFADVPPFTLHRYPMETVDVSMLGRPARIHNGVFRLGSAADALLLPFYLTFKNGRFDATIFDPVDLRSDGAPQVVADRIGLALCENYESCIVAGYPAMYGFAPAK